MQAKAMRSRPTDAEHRLWQILRAKRLPGWKFRRQQPIGPYIADFYCAAGRLVVEADGSQHGDSAYDARRDTWLRAQGLTILRIWNADIFTNEEGVCDMVLAALETPLPNPSPARGEGLESAPAHG